MRFAVGIRVALVTCAEQVYHCSQNAEGRRIGVEEVPLGRLVAQRRGSRHMSDLGDNNNDNKQRQRNNDDHQEDSGVGELVSEVDSEGGGPMEGVQSHNSLGVVRGLCKSVLVKCLVE